MADGNLDADVDGDLDGEWDAAAGPDTDLHDAVRPALRLPDIPRSTLLHPLVLEAAAALVLGLIVLAWPSRTDRVIAHLVALAAAGAAVAIVVNAVRTRHRPGPTEVVTALGAVALAAVLFATAGRSATVLGRLLAVAVLAFAFRSGIAGRARGLRGLPVPAMTLVAGLVLVTYPSRFFEFFTVVAAIGLIAGSLIVIAVAIDPASDDLDDATPIDVLRRWFADRPKGAQARLDLFAKVFYEGGTMRSRLSRFYALMGFATVIAAGGVVTDSTAVVIGAMLIAPLMTPLMGMAVSLVMGWPNRLLRSSLVALSGIVLTIGVSLVLGRLLPVAIDTATNSQIVSRTSPNTLDLVIAVAAGAAGAFGLSRPDVSDALPGVAIAISLVPPLAVVGLTWSQGDWSSGIGALLLFATNMIAILTVGGLTFVVTGITPLERVAASQHRVRTALAAVASATVIVLGGLFLNGTATATNLVEQSRSESLVGDWLADSPDHRAVDVTIDGSEVRATVAGPADGLPDVDDLAATLSSEFGRGISVDVTLRVEQRLSSTGSP